MKKILTEPLVHFLIIGAVLFALFSVVQKSGDNSQDKTIVISANDINSMRANFVRTWQRNPTASELDGIIEDKIRDEIAYREAMAMGLDEDDAYLKKRLRMKMELLFEDADSLIPPTDTELEQFLKTNRNQFKEDALMSFDQIYFNTEKHQSSLSSDIASLLSQLNKNSADLDLEAYGDPTLLPKTYPLTPLSAIEGQFGPEFTAHLDKTAIGKWQGPIPSGYGYHLVLIHAYKAARDPELAEIRPLVEREYMAKRRKESVEIAYAKLLTRYKIERAATETANSNKANGPLP